MMMVKWLRFTSIGVVLLLLCGSSGFSVLPNLKYQDSEVSGLNFSTCQGTVQQVKKQVCFTTPEIREDGNFTNIVIPECTSYIMNAGKPMLPIYTQTITFPVRTEIVNVDFIFSSVQKARVYQRVIPASEHVPLDMKKANYYKSATTLNKDVYSSFTPYPNTWYSYNMGRGLNRGERVLFLSLDIYPVRYIPGQNTIQYVKNAEITIRYKPSEMSDIPSSTTNNISYDLLIIAPEEFSDSLQPLIDHKRNNMSISTMLVTPDGIYSSSYFPVQGRDKPEQIKYFIKNAYDQWDTRYVLLVGGKKNYFSPDDWWIPVRRIHIKIIPCPDPYTSISDLYYADLYNGNNTFSSWDANHNDLFGEGKQDDLDLYPDVYLGRLPCINENDVKTMVNKIIRYENQNDSTWFNRIILCGGDCFPGSSIDGEYMPVGEYIEQEILNVMKNTSEEKSFIGIKLWMSLKSLTKNNIIKEINRGAGFIDFSGHGGETGWETYAKGHSQLSRFTTGDMERLGDNNGGYPVAIIDACDCGDFSYKSPCFAWELIKHQNGGAIASCASTDTSWMNIYNDPTSSVGGLLEVCSFKSYINDSQTFGKMWSGAINLYIEKRGGKYFDSGDCHTLAEWQPFGDPSLKLKSLADSALDNHAPDKPAKVSGSLSGKAGEQYSFNTSVITDQDGDNIYYLFDWDDGTDSGYLGPYNNTTGQATHVWKKDGAFQVKVKAVDMHGFEGTWSKPLNVSITYLEDNYVWLIGTIAYTLKTGNSIQFYSRQAGFVKTTRYIDFNPPEFKRYPSGILFSVDPQYFGIITSQRIFGRFNIQFIYEE